MHSEVWPTSRPGFDSLTVHARQCPGSPTGRGAAFRPRRLGVRIPRRVPEEGWPSGPRRRPAKANRLRAGVGSNPTPSATPLWLNGRAAVYEAVSCRFESCQGYGQIQSGQPQGRVAPGGGQPVLKTGPGSHLRVRLLHPPRSRSRRSGGSSPFAGTQASAPTWESRGWL